MTLLINGCSFAEVWPVSKNFASELGCDGVTNLGKKGTSFSRSVRTTIEWIAQNDRPQMIIIPITLSHRTELSIANKDHKLEGTWFPIQRKELIDESQINRLVDPKMVKEYIDHYYGILPDIRTHWDQLFTQIISLSGFLESKSIKYLMFDMCNDFKKSHINNFCSFEKIKFIEQNKNIIDLFSFCGNRFMWNTMSRDKKAETNELLHHHDGSEYLKLENKILEYIKSCG